MNKKVSVIMSVYNESEDMLSSAVKSILNQSYDNIEFVIILDNPDNARIKEYLIDASVKDDRIKLHINDVNLGLIKSLNTALKMAKGYYIARMDADDISFLNRIEAEVKYLEENKLDFVFSNTESMDEDGNYVGEKTKKEMNYKQIRKIFPFGNISPHPTWLVKKEVYDKLDGYRNALYCEDYDFSLRSLDAGYKIGKLNEKTLYYRVRADSISRKHSLNQFINARELSKIYRRGKINDKVQFEKAIQFGQALSTEKNVHNFQVADTRYNKGIKRIKSGKKAKGVVNLISTIFISKYFFLKLYDLMRYKLINRYI